MQLHPPRFLLTLALCTGIAVAQGDDCSNPKPVSVGSFGPFTSVGATSSAPLVWPCEPTAANDVWFVARANALGTATFDTCGSGFDTVLEVFDGTAGCAALVSLGCNDDSCGTRSLVTVNVTAGLLLYIRVGGFNGATGSFVLNAAGALGTATGFADAIVYGSGCYNGRASFYEFIQLPANFDLSNSSFSMLPTGGGYTMVTGLSGFVVPTPSATPLIMGDDTITTVALTSPFPTGATLTPSLEVCSNGYISTGPGNGASAVINVVNFLNAPATTWRNMHDYDPSAGGQVTFEEVGTTAYITWTNVPDWSVAASASTFQFQFDSASGIVTFAFQQMSLTGSGGGGNGHLIGYSPGGASLDPGATDLSVAIPATFSVRGTDSFELLLRASARPMLSTSLMLNSSNVPATATIGFQVFSFTKINPGIDLASFGAAGCRQFLGLDVSAVIVPSAGTAAWPLGIPGSTSFVGLHIYAQSAMLVPGVNALGVLTSNGVDLRIDVN